MSAPLRSGAVSNRVMKSLLRSTATCVSVTATSQPIICSPVSERPSRPPSPVIAASISSCSYGSAFTGGTHHSSASATRPVRLHRPARWTSDGHGAASVISTAALRSIPASTTWVATTMRSAGRPVTAAMSSARSTPRNRECSKVQSAGPPRSCLYTSRAASTVLSTTSVSVPGRCRSRAAAAIAL